MIEDLRIRDLGVILDAGIELAPGLTAITGETGAGKTMLLSGLGLLLGGRADGGAVRPGAREAVVEGRLLPPPGHPALAVADEAGAVLDEGALLIVRTVAAAGRSRAHLGGRSVPQGLLAQVTEELVTVHGQSDQIRLRAPAQQRAALDEFAGPAQADALAALAAAHTRRAALAGQLADWDSGEQARSAETAALTQALERVEAAEPQSGEQVALREEATRLDNVEDLRAAALTAHAALAGDPAEVEAAPGAVDLIDAARRALEAAQGSDPAIAGWARRVGESSYLLSDLATEVSSYLAGLEADPDRLEQVHARRALLADLSRDYAHLAPEAQQEDPDAAVLAYAEQARRRHAELTAPNAGRDRLEAELAEAEAAEAEAAAKVSANRAEAASRLEQAVDAELAGLAMAGAHLHVRLTPREHIGPHGAEHVELDLTANRGGKARPLAKGASGGELSRVMLALEVALAAEHTDRLPTFIFDEVDAGIGGAAAVEVGRRLADLARSTQVIVVTHLAQVASFADTHVVVTKSTAGGADAVTASDIRTVTGAERERELARMLSGDPTSETALAHAADLLARPGMAR